jgi:hypothetical protein
MVIVTVALDRLTPRFANYMLESCHRLLLRRLRAGHVEDFFFHDRAVQIVHAIIERNLGQRQPG